MPDSSAGTAADLRPFVRIGCAGLPPGVARGEYFERLDLLEIDQTFFEPPREALLKRWRRDTPADCGLTCLAWQLVTHEADSPGYQRMTSPLPPEARPRVGGFRDTPEVRDAWRRTIAAARTLSAEAVLIQTPPSFSPSQANRDALRRFIDEVIGDVPDLALAWEPRGVWAPEQAGRLAEELGLIYTCDPLQLEVPPPEADKAYFRVYGLGLYRNRIADDHLDVLAEMAEAYEQAWVVFANTEKYADAQRFRKVWAGRGGDAG